MKRVSVHSDKVSLLGRNLDSLVIRIYSRPPHAAHARERPVKVPPPHLADAAGPLLAVQHAELLALELATHDAVARVEGGAGDGAGVDGHVREADEHHGGQEGEDHGGQDGHGEADADQERDPRVGDVVGDVDEEDGEELGEDGHEPGEEHEGRADVVGRVEAVVGVGGPREEDRFTGRLGTAGHVREGGDCCQACAYHSC